MTPREPLEVAIAAALLGITQANGYAIARDIRTVTRRFIKITDVPPEMRPAVILLTEENASEYIELSHLKETTLTVNCLLYETIRPEEEPATVLNGYAAAIRQVLTAKLTWGGLADLTEISGVSQHQILEDMLPDAITTVAATVTYTFEEEVNA